MPRIMRTLGPTRLDTKLKVLNCKEMHQLIRILNCNNSWLELAAVLTHPDNPMQPLFDSDNMQILLRQWQCNRNPAEEMLFHWITSGRNLPDMSDLIYFLEEAHLYRALFDVMKNILKEDNSRILGNIYQCEEADIIAEALTYVESNNIKLFSYRDLQAATNNFCGGSTIGEGTFGSVHRVVISNRMFAVKRFKDPFDKNFITEIKTLARYVHENLLSLLGCSLNGPACCLVYAYMSNGSLRERLECVGNSEPLPWELRLQIAFGSARGIDHLHTFGETPMVHRDIKSANILLDEDFVPKVGDFGLVRIGDSGISTLMPVTENICGTPLYMAHEAFDGDVYIKFDTFSFGVVLLELLTGSLPVDEEKFYHLKNCDNILGDLDQNIIWNPTAAKELHEISKRCLKTCKRERPTISQILDDLEACLSHIPENTY